MTDTEDLHEAHVRELAQRMSEVFRGSSINDAIIVLVQGLAYAIVDKYRTPDLRRRAVIAIVEQLKMQIERMDALRENENAVLDNLKLEGPLQ